MRSRIAGMVLGVAASLALATSALATDCVNASKPPGAGVQVILDGETDQPIWTTPGVANRLEQGLIDPDTGDGLHGLVGIDLDGDGSADVSTWFGVGPEGDEIPDQAQLNGPACRGITNFETYFSQCLGG